jgi:hypothetical protein
MEQHDFSLGRFDFERRGSRLLLHSPNGLVETDLSGFLRGVRHLLKMEFELEGSAELDGGLIFRVAGERIQLKLGDYVEIFPANSVAALFKDMLARWAPEP